MDVLNNICLDMVQAMQAKDEKGNYCLTKGERQDFNGNIDLIKKMLDTAREIDLQPIKFINSIEEGEFSAQKALQGMIMNDKSMIENGNIVLEKQAQIAAKEVDLDSDLKLISEAFMSKHIDNL